MRFNILSDSNAESKLDKVLDDLSDVGYRTHFAERDYGDGVAGVTVVFMCQDPDLNLKRRIRFAKKEKKLYMDIMLDLPQMKVADYATRMKMVIERLLAEVPETVSKYKFDDFDTEQFISDFRGFFGKSGLGAP